MLSIIYLDAQESVLFPAEAPLQWEGYTNLMGANNLSWGWNLQTRKLLHGDGIDEKNLPTYPAVDGFSVPQCFFSEFSSVLLDIYLRKNSRLSRICYNFC